MEESQDKPPTGFKPVRLAASAALSALSETCFRDLANTRVEGRPIVRTLSMAPSSWPALSTAPPYFPRTTPRSVHLEQRLLDDAQMKARIEAFPEMREASKYPEEKGGHEQWISV